MARFNQAQLLFLLAELCRLPTTRRGQTQLGGAKRADGGTRAQCKAGLRIWTACRRQHEGATYGTRFSIH